MVQSISNHNDVNAMISKLQKFGSQFIIFKWNMPNNFFLKYSHQTLHFYQINWFLFAHKSTIHHRQLDAIHLCKCGIFGCISCKLWTRNWISWIWQIKSFAFNFHRIAPNTWNSRDLHFPWKLLINVYIANTFSGTAVVRYVWLV